MEKVRGDLLRRIHGTLGHRLRGRCSFHAKKEAAEAEARAVEFGADADGEGAIAGEQALEFRYGGTASIDCEAARPARRKFSRSPVHR